MGGAGRSSLGDSQERLSVITGLDRWTGLLD